MARYSKTFAHIGRAKRRAYHQRQRTGAPTMDVTLAATLYKALAAWEADPEATILTNGTLYAIGRYPAVAIGHTGWTQTSPEALEAAL